MIRNGHRHGLVIREAFTYTTLDREVAPPQPISIIANVASDMTNLALCQRNISFSSCQERIPWILTGWDWQLAFGSRHDCLIWVSDIAGGRQYYTQTAWGQVQNLLEKLWRTSKGSSWTGGPKSRILSSIAISTTCFCVRVFTMFSPSCQYECQLLK